MRILVEEGNESVHAESPFFNKFKNHPNLELRGVPPHLEEKYRFHFVVADNESYRFEPDKTKATAIVAFGHTEVANELEGIFEAIWERITGGRLLPRVH